MIDSNVKHFSNKFNLKIDKLPSHAVDRYSVFSATIFVLLSFVLMAFGLCEYINGVRLSASEVAQFTENQSNYIPHISPNLFDFVLFMMGFCLLISMIFAIIRYKKIDFDGDFIRIIIRPALGSKIRITEPIYLYEGISFRTEFLQYGLINRTKYIIELVHKDKNKIVPLYISTSNKNIRNICESYAKKLHLPVLIYTNNGIIKKSYKDLDLSIKELALKEKIPYSKSIDSQKPNSISVEKENENTIIKIHNIFFDAYNIICSIFLILFSIGLFYAIRQHELLSIYFSKTALLSVYFIGFMIVFFSLILVCKKDKLIITDKECILFHNYSFYSVFVNKISKDKIEEVEIVYNPASGRSYIAVISDENTLILGKKLPMNDSCWLKQFIICELIK